jgi:nucleotidyltransferase/DNA polymerase involved in DNA repair
MTLAEAQAGRVIAHIDLDAFYCAVRSLHMPRLHLEACRVCCILVSRALAANAM